MVIHPDELVAAITHEANRVYCKSIGDYSQPHWEEAPEWQRKSAIEGVHNIVSGRVTKPQESHEMWLKHKEADGWIYGPVKDPEKKQHPCMVPYEQLPKEQKVKDHIFFSIVNALTRFE